MAPRWNLPSATTPYIPPTRVDISPLTQLPEYFNKLKQQGLANERANQAMAMREQQMKQAQAQQAQMNEFRNRQFDATQDYRNKTLSLEEKKLKLPRRSGPNSDLQRRRLELQIQKMERGPQLNPLQQQKLEILKSLLGGGAREQTPPAATLQPQSNETPINPNPNIVPTQTAGPQQPGQQTPSDPMANLTPEQRQAMALNLISPGMGNPLLANNKAAQFTKPTRNEIDKRILNTAEGMARLNGIQKSFKPEFLTFRGGAKGMFLALKDKARIGKLSPDETNYLTEFSQFKQNSIENINRYIKEITGAQMSEAEATRLRQGMPDPGDRFWNGDSPTQFKAKMDNTVGQLKLAAARYNYLRSARFKASGGKGGSNISLQKMRGIINKRAVQIKNELRVQNPGMDRKMIERQAYRLTAQEFGI